MAMTPVLETMEIGIATDVGCVRELNEDAVLGQLLAEGAQNPWQLSALIAVADGMGGHDGGEVASQLASDTARRIFASGESPVFPVGDVSGNNLLERLREAVQYINREVHNGSAGEGIYRPGTTLTVCLIRPREYCIGHVGDSRAYLIRQEGIEQVTEDDSFVAEMVRQGQMTEEEAQTSEFRNRITKAIGLEEKVDPSVYRGQWKAGDVLLACSDGLSEYVRAPELLELVKNRSSLQDVCDECIRLARERGGHDNISVVAIRNAAPAKEVITSARTPETWPPAGSPPEAARIPDEILQEAEQRSLSNEQQAPAINTRPPIPPIARLIMVLVVVGICSVMLGAYLASLVNKNAMVTMHIFNHPIVVLSRKTDAEKEKAKNKVPAQDTKKTEESGKGPQGKKQNS